MGGPGARGAAPLIGGKIVSACVGLAFFGGPVAMVSLAVSARTVGYVDARDIVAARVRQFLVPARAAADAERVPLALILAVASAESAGRPAVRSSAGAVGLMQILPSTAGDLVADGRTPTLTDPATALTLGARYLRRQLDRFDGYAAREELALCAYNAGPGAVGRWLADDPFPPDQPSLGTWIPPRWSETRAYVRRVTEWQQYWRAALASPATSR